MPTRIYDYGGAPKIDYDEHLYYGEPVLSDHYEIEPSEPLSVAISGGSMGGLFTALALRQGGHEVEVFERNPRGQMESQGAGIIAHPEMLKWLDRRRIVDREDISISTDWIDYLDADGSVIHEREETIYTTSWDTVYRSLRAEFGMDRYHMGCTVTGVDHEDDDVIIRFEDGSSTEADLAVIAEGYRSNTRPQFLPDVSLEYAGYIAWRGTVSESMLSSDLLEQFGMNYTFYHSRNSQILSYPVPGPTGEITPGERRINWVWYHNVPETDLPAYLRARDGSERSFSIPPGTMHPEVEERLRALSHEKLPPEFTRLVELTDEPFIQSIHDLAVPQMVFSRTCILGDAAFFIRPHMASGTAKAAADGFRLAEVLTRFPDDMEMALSVWEESQLARGAWLVAKARQRGDIYTGRR